MPILEAKRLIKEFESIKAVAGVDFEIDEGETLTLLGPSGCGKTTILRCIAGLEAPTTGDTNIEGNLIFSSEKNVNQPIERRGLSMVPQSYAIWPHMTEFENVAYGLRARKEPGAENIDKAL